MSSARVGLSLDLSGLDAIESLAKQRAITLKAIKAGAKLVQAGAKARAPKRKGSGALKQSLGVKAVKGKRGKTLALAVIGARKKVSKMVKPPRGTKLIKAVPAFYAHLVEDGTKPHSIRKGSKLARKGKPAAGPQDLKHPGSKPRPFLRPAWSAVKDEALAAAAIAFGGELQKAIEKQSARLLAKLR